MGQIVSSAAKPKRCNLQSLSQLGTPAAGEHILVSSDNSMNAAGQGNFDCYVEGVGNVVGKELPLKAINNEITSIVDGTEVATKTNAQYIRYSDGTIVITGSWFDVFTIPNNGYVCVKAKLASAGDDIAAIAFYSTDTVTAEGYMASASIQHLNTWAAGDVYTASVPDGCKLIAIVNRNAYIAEPTIELVRNNLASVSKQTDENTNDIAYIQEDIQVELDGADLAEKTNLPYIRYSDGAKVGSGPSFDIYSVKNNSYYKVSAVLACADSVPAAIAFYSTETISTSGYLKSDSIQHKNTGSGGATFEAEVPRECKLIVFTNRNNLLEPPTISIYANLPANNAERIDKIEEAVGDPTAEYSEELLAALSITSESANWYADSQDFSFNAGDVIKVVFTKVQSNNNSASLQFRASALAYLCGANDVLNGDVQYFSIPVNVTTKIRLINVSKTGATATIYKVLRKDLAPMHPELFPNVVNTKLMQGRNHNDKDIAWSERYYTYQTVSKNGESYQKAISGKSSDRMGTKLFYAVNAKVRITLTDTANYKFAVYVIKDLDRMTFFDSGWITSGTLETTLYGVAFSVTLATTSGSISQDAVAESGIQIEILEPYQEPLVTNSRVELIEEQMPNVEQIPSIITNVNDTLNEDFIFGTPCYSHLFIDKIGINDMPAIPCQSLYDVDAAARLGFKYIELNVQFTSDGVPIAIHGQYFTPGIPSFGYEVTDVNGECTDEVCKAVIGQKTYAWVAQNVRYKSKYAKHRTTIVPLEEILKECKKHGISAMMTFNDTTRELARKYFNDNWIAYGGYRAGGFAGMVMHYSNAASEEDVLAECDAVKPPYIHMMTNDAFNTFLNAGTLADIFQKIRLKGCLAGIAGCYHSAEQNVTFFDNGGDVTASAEFVNDFQQGNICNLKGDALFSDFEITGGTTTDGVLTLITNGTIGTNLTEQVYLGKGSLRLRFNGTLEVVTFGHNKFTGLVLTSDGSTTKWISTYFLEQVPTFTLKANASTQVFMIDYKASKV